MDGVMKGPSPSLGSCWRWTSRAQRPWRFADMSSQLRFIPSRCAWPPIPTLPSVCRELWIDNREGGRGAGGGWVVRKGGRRVCRLRAHGTPIPTHPYHLFWAGSIVATSSVYSSLSLRSVGIPSGDAERACQRTNEPASKPASPPAPSGGRPTTTTTPPKHNPRPPCTRQTDGVKLLRDASRIITKASGRGGAGGRPSVSGVRLCGRPARTVGRLVGHSAEREGE
ncbi:hypothetical protein IWZ03DRAFT_387640 [Phyllosticta citriasiana]|uniref:Uncharacterized protein n=1 Tax=Phyllosticta citriasiana TaxID=595635 RepID=A0ABR1KA94_9PEZI